VCESDFSDNLAKAETEESDAVSEYETVTQQNKVTKTTLDQDVKYKTQEFKGLDKGITELTSDKDTLTTELNAVLEYYEQIKDRCIAKPESYEERKKRREAELFKAMMANTSCARCSRCGQEGHFAKDCKTLSFYRPSVMERRAEAAKQRAEREAEAAKRRAEWETRQEEKARKQAEWKVKQVAWEARNGKMSCKKEFDVESNATEASTTASTYVEVDEEEVERLAMLDKEVRKHAKVLRDILKLEGLSQLDSLQKAKITRKEEVEIHINSAKGFAKVRARDQLRRQARA